MTLPEQSDRAVKQTREFLVRLTSPYVEGGIKGIRREVRAEASRLLRHYPLSGDGDCPERDNGTDQDTVGSILARRITGLQPTLEVAKLPEEVRRLEGVIAASHPTLTDEEREAVEAALGEVNGLYPETAATLRGLLERTGGER